MSDFKWTEDQQRAIDIRGKNVLVSAAAGSGKTALLTERLKELVLNDGVNCTNLLVLTFTRAAATEMKQRFKQNLFNSLKENNSKLKEEEIIDQINYLTDAQISTIHSFAQSMIKRYFQVLGIDPNFRIVDKAEGELIVAQALDEVFEELFTKHETEPDDTTKNFVELINLYGGTVTNEDLKRLIESFRGFLLTLIDPDEWMSTILEKFSEVNEENFYDSLLLKPLFDSMWSKMNTAAEAYKTISKEFPNINGWKDTAAGKKQLIKELDWFDDFSNIKDNKTFIEQLKIFPQGSVIFPKSGGELSKELSQIRGKKTSNSLYSQICSVAEIAKKYDIQSEYFKTKELTRLLKNLFDLSKLVNERINFKKRERNVLDFNDLEHFLFELLKDENIRQDIQGQYRYIYLDEAQDTNGIQEAILEKIKKGNNRFIVGDIKQSIYRFRNADPTILIEKYHTFDKDENSELVLLNQNFRSRPEIIDAINSIFERLMTEKLGEIEYNDEAKLVATRESNSVRPEINIIELDKFDDRDQIQALYIAEKIKELRKQGINYSDIAILYRTVNKTAEKILRVLAEEGIPTRFEGDGIAVNTREIDTFLKLLQLIDNHKQDIPLLSIMNLPIFGFTLDEQSQIRMTYPETPYFYQAVEAYMEEQDNDLADKLKKFYEKLDKYREESKHIEIDDFIWDLMLDSGIYNYFGNMEGGVERKANLRLLLERTKSYKESSLKGITSFLEFVKNLEKNGQSLDTGNVSSDTDDVVKVMSIHKSKGLEFPVVFVADLNKAFKRVSTSNFLFHKDSFFGGKYAELKDGILVKSDTILEESIKTLLTNEQLSEELRLLYVAMTRAEDQLYLVGASKNLSKDKGNWSDGDNPEQLLNSNSMLEWIMRAINSSPDYNPQTLKTDSWDIHLLTSKQIKEGINGNVEVEVIKDEDYYQLKEQIYKQMDKEEPKTVNNKPMKLSVSRVKHQEISEDEPIELVSLEENKTGFSPLEIGTATHKVMQQIDFNKVLESNNLEDAITNEIARIAEDGYIPVEIIPDLDPSEVLYYLNSEIGQRFIKALKEDPDNILKEFPFLYDTDINEVYDYGLNRPVELSGIIDLCFLEDGEWILIDFKTDRFRGEKQWENTRREYATQLNLYEKALSDLTGINVKEKHLVLLNQKRDELIA